jgi:hypothetical protein
VDAISFVGCASTRFKKREVALSVLSIAGVSPISPKNLRRESFYLLRRSLALRADARRGQPALNYNFLLLCFATIPERPHSPERSTTVSWCYARSKLSERMNDRRFSERSALILCILLGTAQAWISRYAMNQDGTSYLDVGDAFFRGDWAKAISGYWSPMYCWWVGLALHVVRPSIWCEFVTVQAANLIIYFVALFCFRFLLHSILRALSEEAANKGGDALPLSDLAFSWLGYGIFLWASLVLIDVANVTPDLLVAAFVFLIGGYLVDLRYRESYPKFAVFGIFCGAAYLTKAAMFLVSFGLLVIFLF